MLSVVPPSAAIALAERLAPALAGAQRKPVYVDCNAVAPKTVLRAAEILAPSGCPFVDAAIFGGPTSGKPGTVLYVSGPHASRVLPLGEVGPKVRVLDGPVGAASALKLSFAGHLTKVLLPSARPWLLTAGAHGLGERHARAARRHAACHPRLSRPLRAGDAAEGVSLGAGNAGDRRFLARRFRRCATSSARWHKIWTRHRPAGAAAGGAGDIESLQAFCREAAELAARKSVK